MRTQSINRGVKEEEEEGSFNGRGGGGEGKKNRRRKREKRMQRKKEEAGRGGEGWRRFRRQSPCNRGPCASVISYPVVFNSVVICLRRKYPVL